MNLRSRHLLGLEGMPASDINLILDTAISFKEILGRKIPKVPTLRGATVVNLFYESSTRTRISFELAEKRLSRRFGQLLRLRLLGLERGEPQGHQSRTSRP